MTMTHFSFASRLRIAAVIGFGLAPLSASAQASVSYSSNSNTGFQTFTESEPAQTALNLYNTIYGANLKADALANGNQYAGAGGVEPSYAYNSQYFPSYPDGVWGIGSGFVSTQYTQPTADRLCYDLDPSYPDTTAKGSQIGISYFSSPGNNNVLLYTGSQWWLLEADHHYNLTGTNGDSIINSLTCSSYALPANTLTASSYTVTSAQAAQGVKLTWNDLPARDNIVYPDSNYNHIGYYLSTPNNCTSSGFPLTTTSYQSCDKWATQQTGVGCGAPAAAILAATTRRGCTTSYYCASPSNIVKSNASGTYTVTPTQTTTYTYACTNPNGTTVASATVNVIAPAPTATLTATPSSIQAGGSSKLTWSSTDATSCVGNGFNTSNATSNSSGVSASPSQTTTYSITCTGSGGQMIAYATVAVTNPPITGSCSAVPTTTTTGQTVSWFASASGGTGSYAYSWSGDESLTGTTATVYKQYALTGVKQASVTVTSGGVSQTFPCSNTVTITEPAPLGGTCASTPASGTTATSFTWGVSNLNGSGNYTYLWSGTDGLSGNTASVQKTYSTGGTKAASVTVTDTGP